VKDKNDNYIMFALNYFENIAKNLLKKSRSILSSQSFCAKFYAVHWFDRTFESVFSPATV
jgi:hypothetical protein